MYENEMKEQCEMSMHRRNTHAVEEKIKELDLMIREQNVRINSLNDYISTLDSKFNQLELRMNIEKIKSFGTGPTE